MGSKYQGIIEWSQIIDRVYWWSRMSPSVKKQTNKKIQKSLGESQRGKTEWLLYTHGQCRITTWNRILARFFRYLYEGLARSPDCSTLAGWGKGAVLACSRIKRSAPSMQEIPCCQDMRSWLSHGFFSWTKQRTHGLCSPEIALLLRFQKLFYIPMTFPISENLGLAFFFNIRILPSWVLYEKIYT